MAIAHKTKPSEIPHYKNYINGEWVDTSSGKYIHDTNPANTDDMIGYFPSSTREEAISAIDAAEKAFPAWRNTPAPARGRIFAKVVQIMMDKKEELARIMTREEGKTLTEARGEIQKGINLIEYYSGSGFRLQGITVPSEMQNSFLYTIRQPLGVVSIITPWNFPFSIPCWKIAPALVAGNTVVFKPASLTPLMAIKIVGILEEAGLPKGVLNLVIGSGGNVGDVFVNDKRIKAVSFTGSCETGAQVAHQAMKHLAKVTCEMGGKNPLVIMEDADLELALEGVILGAFGSTGQRCTATSRLILHKPIADKFVEMLLARVKKIKTGPGDEEGVFMGPAVDESQMKTDLAYIDIAKKDGAKLLIGGERLTGAKYDKGFFVAPTVFDNVTTQMRIFKEEVFGPVLSVIRVKDFEEALETANAVTFGLSSSIYSNNPSHIMRFIDGIEAGMTHINSATIGGEAQIPFGGIKETGVGNREMAEEGINFFTEIKTVFYEYSGKKREHNIY